MPGSLIIFLKGMRRMMFQLSGFYYNRESSGILVDIFLALNQVPTSNAKCPRLAKSTTRPRRQPRDFHEPRCEVKVKVNVISGARLPQ